MQALRTAKSAVPDGWLRHSPLLRALASKRESEDSSKIICGRIYNRNHSGAACCMSHYLPGLVPKSRWNLSRRSWHELECSNRNPIQLVLALRSGRHTNFYYCACVDIRKISSQCYLTRSGNVQPSAAGPVASPLAVATSVRWQRRW